MAWFSLRGKNSDLRVVGGAKVVVVEGILSVVGLLPHRSCMYTCNIQYVPITEARM